MAGVTKATIEAAWRNRAEDGKSVRDDQVRGLVLALNREHATWRLEFRLPGTNPETGRRWPNDAWTIGRLAPDLHLPEARSLAREAKVKIGKGINPRLEQRAALTVQLADTAAAVRTVAALIDDYTAARRPRWRPATERAFMGDLKVIRAALGNLPVHHVTRRMLADFLRRFVDDATAAGHRGTRAERLRMLLGSLFLFAVERDQIEVSPAQRLPLPAKSVDRARVLSASEIATVWRSLSEPHVGIGEGLRLALRLSLVTGQRIGAIAMAREADLDLLGQDDPEIADAGPRWLIRGEAGAKAKRDRLLPLSPLAVALFRKALALPGRQSEGIVFRGKAADASLSQQSLSRAWGMLRRAGKVPEDTTPHDLRRTARSLWPELKHGQPAEVMERILGHVVGTKVERVYDRAMWLPQQRAVLDAWGRKLETIARGGAQVVEIQRGLAHG